MRAILQILADFTGLNIVGGGGVKGVTWTLRWQNPYPGIRRWISSCAPRVWPCVRTAMWSSSPQPRKSRPAKLDLESHKTVQELIPLRTEIIQVNYAKAAGLAALLNRPVKGTNHVVAARGCGVRRAHQP